MNKPRGERQGGWHHIFNRGVDGCAIFRNDADRELFLLYLAAAAARFNIEIHAVTLMDNHFHFQVRTPDGDMGAMMQLFKSRYTKKFNRRHQRKGALFGERYQSEPIETTNQLLEVNRYVHNNPVKAGMVKRAQDYLWSTMAAYLGKVAKPEWLTTETLLAHFSDDPRQLLRFTDQRNLQSEWDPGSARESRYSPEFLEEIRRGDCEPLAA